MVSVLPYRLHGCKPLSIFRFFPCHSNITVLQKMIPNIIEQLSNKFVLVRFTLLMLNLLSCFLFLFSLFSLQHHFMAFDPFKVHFANTFKGKTQGTNGKAFKIDRLYTVEFQKFKDNCLFCES